jgi:hypothetical protein
MPTPSFLRTSFEFIAGGSSYAFLILSHYTTEIAQQGVATSFFPLVGSVTKGFTNTREDVGVFAFLGKPGLQAPALTCDR